MLDHVLALGARTSRRFDSGDLAARLVGNAAYPQIASDYEKTFRVLASLPCDIFLGAHGDYFNLAAKYPRVPTSGVAAHGRLSVLGVWP